MKCPRCDNQLKAVLTKEGVVIDECHSCNGVWLDEGEIFFFTKKPKRIQKALQDGLINPHGSEAKCPRCVDKAFQEGGFIQPDLLVDQCPKCHGLWFDAGELKKAIDLGEAKMTLTRLSGLAPSSLLAIKKDQPTSSQSAQGEEEKKPFKAPFPVHLMALPNLAFRSATCFVALYGLLLFIFIALGEIYKWPIYFPMMLVSIFVLIQYLISPFLMDLSLSWLFRFDWVGIKELPEHLQKFITEVCQKQEIGVPRIGIIEDGAPNAFTYGRTPWDARVVFTRGLMNYLEADELEAVIAHELGHVKHWDILVMTMASLVPVILYTIYRTCIEATKGGGSGKGKEGPLLIALGAFVCYVISEYIVLWLSRVREYWADRFAGEVTRNPNALSRALVKVAYGLVDAQSKRVKEEMNEKGEKVQKEEKSNLESINALGIFDFKAAKSLALHGYSASKTRQQEGMHKEAVADAMQWDLWNPWATYYEIHSTHPLAAKRINALSDQSMVAGEEPFILFNRTKPESYWDEFFVDVIMAWLPTISLVLTFLASIAIDNRINEKYWEKWGGILLFAFGFSYLLKILFSYRSGVFPKMKISSLLGKIKVSGVRPVPVTLKGKVVGKGTPGYIFSEDLVIEDESGIIFLDYRQPFWIFEFFFALFRNNRYQGKEITVQGWYRRAPVPFIEVKELEGDGLYSKCHVYTFKIATALIATGLGLGLMLIHFA